MLSARNKALVALAERLIEKEVIDTAELKEIVEQSSPSPMIVPGTAEVTKRPSTKPDAAKQQGETPGSEKAESG